MSMLKLHNTLTRKKEDFVPINNDHVRVYACGPTVYGRIHVGNARPISVHIYSLLLYTFIHQFCTRLFINSAHVYSSIPYTFIHEFCTRLFINSVHVYSLILYMFIHPLCTHLFINSVHVSSLLLYTIIQ